MTADCYRRLERLHKDVDYLLIECCLLLVNCFIEGLQDNSVDYGSFLENTRIKVAYLRRHMMADSCPLRQRIVDTVGMYDRMCSSINPTV